MVNKEQEQTFENQPDELNALKEIVDEFMKRIGEIDSEIALLKDDRKDVIEEYSTRLDVKTLNKALQAIRIRQGVKHKHTFDMFTEILTDPAQ